MIKQTPHAGFFMVVFLVCAFILGIMGMKNTYETTEQISAGNGLNGRWTSVYEKDFDKSLSFYETSKIFWGVINYVFFKDGRSGVLIGEDGWLFTSEEFNIPHDAEKNIADNLNYVSKVSEIFSDRGIKMIVALVPAKSRVYQEYLGSHHYPAKVEPVYHDIRKFLKDEGIPVTDILWIMEKKRDDLDIFLRTDTHWTPAGAKLAARQVAHEVARTWPSLDLEKTEFITDRTGSVEHEGDLLSYIPLGAMRESIGPKLDDLSQQETRELSDGSAAVQDEASMLFDVKAIPVTLVGTSYSANPLWNFDGFLKEAMNTDILNAADEGMGPFATMQKYLKDASLKETPPKLVVWEIPERYVYVDYDLDKEEE